jgi:RNA polymerase sigma-70 factor (ECF subfamily)
MEQTMEQSDEQVVAGVLGGRQELFEILIRRYNQRLYRVVRGVLRADEGEIEDVMQQAYVNAYLHLDQFAGRASFSTWLTKIALYEALSRARRLGRTVSLDEAVENGVEDIVGRMQVDTPDPERQALTGELREALEGAIEQLPPAYRSVFMLREVEGLSTTESADILGVREEVVKTRLHRARGMLRDELFERAGASSSAAFTFHASRCDRIVERVFAALKLRAGH